MGREETKQEAEGRMWKSHVGKGRMAPGIPGHRDLRAESSCHSEEPGHAVLPNSAVPAKTLLSWWKKKLLNPLSMGGFQNPAESVLDQ